MDEQTQAFAAFDPSTISPVGVIPSVSITGEADLIAAPETCEAALRALGVTRFQTVPNAGHSLHWDAPEATLAALRTALETVP